MKSLRTIFDRSRPDPASLKLVADLVDQIESEMRRIGYWKEAIPEKFDAVEQYAGVSFEEWLQFVFLPQVRNAVDEKDLCAVPPYRVGVAALRQYDYHSSIPEAHPLMLLCHQLEEALPPMEKLRGPNQPVQTRPTSRPV